MTTIARVGTGSGETSVTNATSFTISYTPAGTGRLLSCVGSVSVPSAGLTVSVADSSGTTWSTTLQADDNQDVAFISDLENDRSGLTSVTVTLDGSGYGHAAVDEWSGVRKYGAKSVSVLASANHPASTVASGNLVAADPNCLILGVCGADDSSNTAWNTTLGAWTQIFSDGDSISSHPAQAVYQIASGSTGPFSITWSYPPGNSGMPSVLVAFLPAEPIYPPNSPIDLTLSGENDALGFQRMLDARGWLGAIDLRIEKWVADELTALAVITASASITEANDTLVSAAAAAIAASAAITEPNDSLSSAAAIAIVAASSVTEADDALSAAASASIITSLAATEQDDTLSAQAQAVIAAAAIVLEADDELLSEAVTGTGPESQLVIPADAVAAFFRTRRQRREANALAMGRLYLSGRKR